MRGRLKSPSSSKPHSTNYVKSQRRKKHEHNHVHVEDQYGT